MEKCEDIMAEKEPEVEEMFFCLYDEMVEL